MLDIFENIIYSFHTYKMKASSSINKNFKWFLMELWKGSKQKDKYIY
jgi:hypothetical protein